MMVVLQLMLWRVLELVAQVVLVALSHHLLLWLFFLLFRVMVAVVVSLVQVVVVGQFHQGVVVGMFVGVVELGVVDVGILLPPFQTLVAHFSQIHRPLRCVGECLDGCCGDMLVKNVNVLVV